MTSHGYDWLGRRTSNTDPDTGAGTVDYYPSGAVRHSHDADGTDVYTAIDVLSRPVASYAGTGAAGTLLTTIEYDGTPLGGTGPLKGMVTAKTSFDGSQPGAPGVAYRQLFGYDARSRVVRTDQVIPAAAGAALAGTYTTTSTWDGLGRQTSAGYPAAGGLPAETVTTGWSDRNPTTLTSPLASYVSATSYTSSGLLAGRTLGVDGAAHSVRRAYTWDTATGELLTEAAATPSTSATANLQFDTYTYAPTGDVTKVTDGVAGQQQCFTYDALDRLTAAVTSAAGSAAGSACTADSTGPDPYRQSYTYDDDGNLTGVTSAGVVTSYGYGANPTLGVTGGPHAPTSLTSNGVTTSLSYDAAGQLASRDSGDATTTYTWDARSRLTATTTGTATASFTDGPDGSRWVRRTATETVLYLAGQEVHLAAGTGAVTGVRLYTAQGHTVAVRRSDTGLHWVTGDRQGSVNVTVSADTGEVTRSRYLPYGGDRAAAAAGRPTDRGWLGQVRDADTGLTYLNARYYDPTLAHFISADPIEDRSSPQHANPFGYAADNPVPFSDPSGLTTYYTVAKGENWYTVSARTGLTLDQLRALNGGRLSALAIGQKVNVTKTTVSTSAVQAAMAALGAAAVTISEQQQLAKQIAATVDAPSTVQALLIVAAARTTGYTLSQCSGGEAVAGVKSVSYSICWVATPNGQAGYTVTLGAGGALGGGVTLSGGYTVSNAKSLNDLGGYFGNLPAGTAGGLVGANANVAAGKNDQGKLIWQVTASGTIGWSLKLPKLPGGLTLTRLDQLENLLQGVATSGSRSYTWLFKQA